MEPELIGVTLQGPPPLGRVHIRCESGLSVLYGLNGAGKTSVLRAMRTALTGIRGEGLAALHVRYANPSRRLDPDEVDWSPEGPLVQHLEREKTLLGPYLSSSADKANARSGIAELVIAILSERHSGTWTELPTEIVNEVASQGVFTLVATGTNTPEWALWISGIVDEKTPVLRESVDLEIRHHEWTASLLEMRDSGILEDESVRLKALDNMPTGKNAFLALHSLVEQDHFPWRPGDPTWVPCPIDDCGNFSPLTRFMAEGIELKESDIRDRSVSIANDRGRIIVAGDDGSVGISEHAQQYVRQIALEATQVLEMLLADGPVLRCEFRKPTDWLQHPPLEWNAFDRPSLSWVPIEQLSDAQRLWTNFAIAFVLAGPSYRNEDDLWTGNEGEGRVLLLDEPERGLHARAQRQLAQGLARIGSTSSLTIVAATHSSAFLDDPSATLLHVSRDSGSTQVVKETLSIRNALENKNLGLDSSEILGMIRAFLVVEGVHDQVVINRLIGNELGEARVAVVPMGGTHALKTVVDAHLIFDYTSAAVIIALDRLRIESTQLNWDMVKQLVRKGEVSNAYASLEEFKRRCESTEEKFLYEFLHLAIRSGKTHRVEVFGFSKPDILEYLPYKEFVKDGGSWGALKKDWKRKDWNERGTFKEYLRSRGAKINPGAIDRIAKRMDEIPTEFNHLLAKCQGVTTPPGS